MAMPAQADGGSAIEQCRRYQRDSSVAQPIGSSDGVPRQCSTYHGDVRRLHGINLPSPLLCFCICLVGGSSNNNIEMCLCICMCGSCVVVYRHICIVRYIYIYTYLYLYIYISSVMLLCILQAWPFKLMGSERSSSYNYEGSIAALRDGLVHPASSTCIQQVPWRR